jgi:fibronectin-binding autotransporter adhesin
LARNAAVVEAGLGYALSSSATLGLSYAGQFGHRLADHLGRVNLDVRF